MERNDEGEDSRLVELLDTIINSPEQQSLKVKSWFAFVFYADYIVHHMSAHTREELDPFIKRYKGLTVGVFHEGEWH
jgi:hypothetical protein